MVIGKDIFLIAFQMNDFLFETFLSNWFKDAGEPFEYILDCHLFVCVPCH